MLGRYFTFSPPTQHSALLLDSSLHAGEVPASVSASASLKARHQAQALGAVSIPLAPSRFEVYFRLSLRQPIISSAPHLTNHSPIATLPLWFAAILQPRPRIGVFTLDAFANEEQVRWSQPSNVTESRCAPAVVCQLHGGLATAIVGPRHRRARGDDVAPYQC